MSVKLSMKGIKIEIKLSLISYFGILDLVFRDFYKREFDTDYTGLINKLDVPINLIWGRKDELFRENHPEIFKKASKNIKIDYLDEGHDWPILKPGRIYKTDFLINNMKIL